MSDHAFLAPSSAHHWGPGGCPASPTLQAKYPEPESAEAREGTAAHHFVSEMLAGRPCRAGDVAPNGHPITAEMVECGMPLIEDVRATLAAAGNGAKLMVEARTYGAAILTQHNWGTPDVTILDFTNRRIHNWDYKFGHRYHDAFEHWQSINYILLRMGEHHIAQERWEDWHCTVTIASPRNYHPEGPMRYWEFSGAKLKGYWEALWNAAHAALQPDAPMKTGDYCLDCTAVHSCPAAQRLAMKLVDYSMRGQPIDLPPHALGLELRIIRMAIERLEARAVGLEAAALALNERGTDVPFWRTDYSGARTRWKDDVPVSDLSIYGQLLGIEIVKPQPAMTPNQAIKAGVPEDVVKSLSVTPRGKKKLVPFDDKDAAKRFS